MKVKEKIARWFIAPLLNADGQFRSGIGADGLEYPDPQPFAPHSGIRPPETQGDMILRLVRDARLREMADVQEFDTEEEANDFDIEDDPIDVTTPWEEPFLPPKKSVVTASSPAAAPAAPAPASPAQPPSAATPAASPPAAQPNAS